MTSRMGEGGRAERQPRTWHQAAPGHLRSVTATSSVLYLLPPCSISPAFLCIPSVALHWHMPSVWAWLLALILVLILGYNSHLLLSFQRQLSPTQTLINQSLDMDIGGHYSCQDFLAAVKIRKEEWRGSSNRLYTEAEIIKEVEKKENWSLISKNLWSGI